MAKARLIIFILIVFMLSASKTSGQPSLSRVGPCPNFTPTLMDVVYHNPGILRTISTKVVDSTQICTPSGCYWTYEKKPDTTYAAGWSNYNVIQSCVKFDLQDVPGTQWRMTVEAQRLSSGERFQLLSRWGDTLAEPGTGKTLHYEAEISGSPKLLLRAENQASQATIQFPLQQYYSSLNSNCDSSKLREDLNGEWTWLYGTYSRGSHYDDPWSTGRKIMLSIKPDTYSLYQNDTLICSNTQFTSVSCREPSNKEIHNFLCNSWMRTNRNDPQGIDQSASFFSDILRIIVQDYKFASTETHHFVKPGYERHLTTVVSTEEKKTDPLQRDMLKVIHLTRGEILRINTAPFGKFGQAVLRDSKGSIRPAGKIFDPIQNILTLDPVGLSTGGYYLILEGISSSMVFSVILSN